MLDICIADTASLLEIRGRVGAVKKELKRTRGKKRGDVEYLYPNTTPVVRPTTFPSHAASGMDHPQCSPADTGD